MGRRKNVSINSTLDPELDLQLFWLTCFMNSKLLKHICPEPWGPAAIQASKMVVHSLPVYMLAYFQSPLSGLLHWMAEPQSHSQPCGRKSGKTGF